MNSPFLKKALPHILAVVVFLVVAIVYCKPALEGLILNQQDTLQYKGTPQQSQEYKQKYGHYPLWTESLFSGMPAYTVALEARTKISLGYLEYLLTWGLPAPISYFFTACLCLYILTQVLRINPWIGVLASLAYAYSTYDPVIIVVGHVTKMQAIAFAPGVIASILLIYQRKWLWGAALLTCFFLFQVGTQHLQVVYYTLISAGLLTLFYFIDSFKKKEVKPMLISMAIAAVAMVIGFGGYAVSNLPTQEYAKETMRGGRTELTGNNNSEQYISKNGGLSKQYAFNWSYGIGETFTLLVPDAQGGGDHSRRITGNSKFVDKLAEIGVPEDNALQMANAYAYWGTQPSTAGPVYLGAVCCMLFILGLVFVKGWPKWWLVSVAVTGIVLAWGKNFEAINYFLFDHLPMYNKFRAPTIAMVMPQFAIPLLGALGLDNLLKSTESREIILKKFKQVMIITAALLVAAAGFYFTASYKAEKDTMVQQNFVHMLSRGQQSANPQMQQQVNELAGTLMKNLREDRQSLFGSDLLRTFVLIALAAALIWFYLKGKYTQQVILLAGILVLSSFDLLAIGRRYLSSESFVDPAEFDNQLAATPADQRIKADPEKGFRVYDATAGDAFSDSRASYFHNSVGGYSPAKLGLYMDLIEHQLSKGNMRVFNMLNTKYFIQPNPANGQPQAGLNPDAYGPCWLVKSLHYVKDGNEEMKALDSINVRDTAIVQQQYQARVKFAPVEDSTAKIQLIENLNDKITYKFSSKTNQFAVFSEIYYDKGWNVFIDGTKADYIRVDYVLRGMSVPAGAHTIEWRFEPHSYELGNTITIWSSLLGYLLLIIAGVVSYRKKSF
ncbi:YfhO family protein [Flavitalea sp. BT771]|uniref:YfhO family protein n=1 Tax=Flavitalea sp. BT771 TaxID=3063329 RepID=UPI0026E49240|nr:YfhO family protein [Flavitalea sp. BT771]MDO6431583.1 YfhO family protein [Flavitalea sp. BT771]MDV6220491.1 YfhO family protein [Flavitalea sp. BT771]